MGSGMPQLCIVLYRECAVLKEKAVMVSHQMRSCTNATMDCSGKATCEAFPTNCRKLNWEEFSIDKSKCIGKGAFGSCYIARFGTINKICLKVLHHSEEKFKRLSFPFNVTPICLGYMLFVTVLRKQH